MNVSVAAVLVTGVHSIRRSIDDNLSRGSSVHYHWLPVLAPSISTKMAAF